jgi:hypothetical protein
VKICRDLPELTALLWSLVSKKFKL